jgi:hypothetical protein
VSKLLIVILPSDHQQPCLRKGIGPVKQDTVEDWERRTLENIKTNTIKPIPNSFIRELESMEMCCQVD